jgi:phage terminase large subunit GpA-like protein
VKEYMLNVDKLKTLSVERIIVDDEGPGQVYFASGLPKAAFDELCGEALVDGKWERRGANETLDLFGYCEAARVQLQPERATIKWDVRRPVWARPVKLEEADPLSARRKGSLSTEGLSPIQRLAAINRS